MTLLTNCRIITKGFVGKLRSGGALQTLWSIFAASGRCSLCLVGNTWDEKEISMLLRETGWVNCPAFLNERIEWWKNECIIAEDMRDVSLLCFWIIRGKWELQWDASANFFHYNLCLFSITLAQHTLSAKCTYLCKWKQKSLLFSGKDVVGTSRKLPLFVNLRVHLQWWYNILIFFRGLGFLHNLQQIFLHVFFPLSQTPLNLDTHLQVNTSCYKYPSSSFLPSGSCAEIHSQNPWTSLSYPPFPFWNIFYALSNLLG